MLLTLRTGAGAIELAPPTLNRAGFTCNTIIVYGRQTPSSNHIEDGDDSASPAVCDRTQLGHAFAKACKRPQRAKLKARNPPSTSRFATYKH